MIRFLQTERPRYFFSSVLAQVAQYYVSINLGTLSLVILIVAGAMYCWSERSGKDRFFLILKPSMRRLMLLGVVMAGVLLLPLVHNYLLVMREWTINRSEA